MLTLQMNQNECEPISESGVSNRTLANRRNALKSTGPRTEAGKAVSRRNAMKLGLAGQGVVLPREEEQEASERAEAWLATTRPRNPIEEEMVRLAAVTLTQLRACHREEALARARLVDRAEHLWDLDRDAEIARLVDQLANKPERIIAQLRCSAHGAAWLLCRWIDLEARLAAGVDWDEATHSHALDLLGVPAVFRDQFSPLDRPDADTNPDALRAQRLSVARDQIAYLENIIDNGLIHLDDDDRATRMSYLVVVPDPTVSRLRRYEVTLSKRFMTLLTRIQRFSTTAARDSGSNPPNQTNPTHGVATSVPKMPARSISTHDDTTSVATMGSPPSSSLNEPGHDQPDGVQPQPPSPTGITCLHDALLHLPTEYVEMPLGELRQAFRKVDMNDTLLVQSMSYLLRARLYEESDVSML